MPEDNYPRITLQSNINSGNTIPVLDAIIGNIPFGVRTFVTTPFVNSHNNEESVGRALTITEMSSLKNEIIRIVQNFNQTMAGSNLSAEQWQEAKLVYIFNYILANVHYANVLSAQDGTGRVVNRIGDFNIYESAYTALVLKSSICCGISDAVYLLCKAMGIECEKWLWPNGGHAFNKVKIGNTWYKLDATFQIGLYPNAKADEWNTNYFLTATDQPTLTNSVSRDYPRQRIQLMKAFLERRGVNFSYLQAPRITIKTPLDGLKDMANELNQTIDLNNLLQNIVKIDEAMSSKATITIHNRTDTRDPFAEKPVISYIPKDKKIIIQRYNYKINIISFNDCYIINTETPDNSQRTFITDRFGNIIGELKRRFEVFMEHIGLTPNNSPTIVSNNINENNSFRI